MNQENEAYYLYGIIKGEIEGVSTVSHNEISGVISKVSLDEFGEEALKKNLESMDWVTEKVFNHERVVEDVMKKTTVIPMKFCTIFKSTENILKLLEEKYSYFKELLDRFSNSHEWGLKIYCAARPEPVSKAISSGREYLMAKKEERERALEFEEAVNNSIEDIYREVRTVSEDFRLNRPTPKELLSGKDKEQVLNASFLVLDSNRDRLIGMADGLAKKYQGLELALAGPLPVYSFVGGDLDEYSK